MIRYRIVLCLRDIIRTLVSVWVLCYSLPIICSKVAGKIKRRSLTQRHCGNIIEGIIAIILIYIKRKYYYTVRNFAVETAALYVSTLYISAWRPENPAQTKPF